MSETLLSIKNLTMKFGGVTALNDVTIEVKKGEILALIGPNGAGKTTVFNVITGVYKATSGVVTFEGTEIRDQARYKITQLGLARTFQNIRLWGEMTALENVITATDVHKKSGLVGALFGLPRARREERENREHAMEMLRFIGIEEYADRLAKNLPYGVLPLVDSSRCRMGGSENGQPRQVSGAVDEYHRLSQLVEERHMSSLFA